MTFYLITYKEFKGGKMIDNAELIKADGKADGKGDFSSQTLNKMKTFNAQKSLTTTDYVITDLSKLFELKGLEIKQVSFV